MMNKLIRMSIGMMILLMCFANTAQAARPRTRQVVMDTIANVPEARMQEVIDKFCYQFQACPDSLFGWAYKGTGDEGTGQGKDAIMLRYKDRTYDAEKRIGDVAIDIIVLGSPMFRNNHFGTIYHDNTLTATYSGSLLEGGEIKFILGKNSSGQTTIHYSFTLTFGRFLSSIISDKMWMNTADWRFRVILHNLVEYAETGTVSDKKK